MRKRIVLIIFVICILTGLTSCSGRGAGTAAFSGFSAYFLNTGKSDCMIIRIDDFVLMCDTAESDDYNHIIDVLANLGTDRIDALILSHFDKDHIGCAGAVIRNYNVGTVYAPDTAASSGEYKKLTDGLQEKGMSLTYVTEDVTIPLQSGSVTIYAPQEDTYDNDNAYSLITEIKYKDNSMLLTGDATKKRLTEFLSHTPVTAYDVIKLPHHGEYTKSLLSLFGRASAKYGIITCDAEKSTVEDKTISSAEKYGTMLLYTCDGDIELVFRDGEACIKE